MGARLLEGISSPSDFRGFSVEQLRTLAAEVRQEIIDTVSRTGGHLGAGLGVVELTIALHYVFNTPDDRLIWDVGHQAYPHKILTGRRDRMPTLRQGGGLSGFTRRSESIYDPFGAGHSSTSISAGLGMAVARDLKREQRNVIAVIGDGSMSAGMAYEAMNNAAATKSRLIVVLNDNDMSIAPPVGAMSAYLSRLLSSRPYQSLRLLAKDLASMFPPPLERMAKQAEEYARGMVIGGGTLFEEMGFYYVGPLDGHNLNHLLPLLKNVRDRDQTSPVLIHVVTHKGKGYPPAEAAMDKYHGVGCFNAETGELIPASSQVPTYTEVFGRALVAEARMDPAIVAITAAMPTGTGLDHFAAEYPERVFDVGIAEQHAVTFAAGLACEGLKPVCALYSSFLQRAYDQLVHDVALQNLPVRFALDRAGLVGADGATHAGVYDLAFLGCIPNMVLMAPANEAELMHMVATSIALDEHPSALRYPRGAGVGLDLPEWGTVLPLGKGRILREGTDVAILCLGPRLAAGMKAAEMLDQHGIQATVADARFMKPLDRDLILRLAREHPLLVTVEEGASGGFGAQVMHLLAHAGALDRGLKIRPMTLPDRFIEQDTMVAQYRDAGLDDTAIMATVREALGL